jgi:hypothetical protein
MQNFCSRADLAAASLSPPVHRTVEQALSVLVAIHSKGGRNYSPDDDGYVVLAEPSDTPETIRESLGYLPKNLPWEGGYRDGKMLVGILLRNNQFGLTVVVSPDANAALLKHLLAALDDERKMP